MAAMGTGEEVEQLFSYLFHHQKHDCCWFAILLLSLSLLAISFVGREEHITEAASYWNIKKIVNLPFQLVQRLNIVSSIMSILVPWHSSLL